MSTLLATVAVLAALGAYYVYQNSNDAQAQISQINAIASTTKSMYLNASSTSDLVTNTVAASGNLPTAWVSGTSPNMTILSPSRTPIQVIAWSGITSGVYDGFEIIVTTSNVSTCIALLTTTFGPGFRYWQSSVGTGYQTFFCDKPAYTHTSPNHLQQHR